MADRTIGRDAVLYADFPALSVRITNPVGTVYDALDTYAIGNGRYAVDVPSVYHSMSGVYTVEWDSIQQIYTVGEQPLAGMNKWTHRIAVARRLGAVKMGRVTEAYSTSISDVNMIGGTNENKHWYLMLPPGHTDAGIAFRVLNTNGSSLEVSQQFSDTPLEGQPFALFQIDPVEIDEAINLAVSDVSEIQRIPVMLTDLPVVNGLASIPRGVIYISQLFNEDGAAYGGTSWTMQSGRRVLLSGEITGNVSMLGLRGASLPVWEDSVLETPSAVTVPRAAMTLHASRAGGQAVDVEENLRRQLAAQDEFDRAMRRTAGRVPRGMVEVLP